MPHDSKSWIRLFLIGGVVASSMVLDVGPTGIALRSPEAEAVIGRPLTPGSYAGVARRTSRRTTRRAVAVSSAYGYGGHYSALPGGCVGGAGGYYNCGAVGYRAVYDGPNVVYIRL